MTAIPAQSTRRAEFTGGIKATIPLILGAIPFGIIFGAVAVTSGLTPWQAQAMSLFVFAGSAEFIAVGLIAQELAPALVILTTFVVNLRHALYSASLAPYMKHLPQRWLIPLGFWLTDESYAVVITRYREAENTPHAHWFFFGSALAMYVNWQICTFIGIVAGQQIPDPASWGLDFAMIVTFIGIVVPFVTNRPALASVIVSGIVAVAANNLPNKLGLMLAAVLGIAAGLIAESVWPQPISETSEVAA